MGDTPTSKEVNTTILSAEIRENAAVRTEGLSTNETNANPVIKSNNPFKVDSDDLITDKALEEGFYPPEENENAVYDTMKGNLENTISMKESKIVSLTKTIEEYDNRFAELIAAHEVALKLRDEELEKNRVSQRSTRIFYNKIESSTEQYRLLKTSKKKRGSSTNCSVTYKCEFDGCGKENIDMVRCNNCDSWVCESCNDVNVSKLKAVTDKCPTIYFLCKSCDSMIDESADQKREQIAHQLTLQKRNEECQRNIMKEREQTIDELSLKISEMESKSSQVQNVDKIIEKKFEVIADKLNKDLSEKLSEKMAQALEKINDKLTTIPEKIDQNYESFKDVVVRKENTTVPTANFKEIMTEERNEQLVQDRERKRRAMNVIIHGVPEEGNDKSYVEDLLQRIGVTTVPESVLRLGNVPEVSSSNKIRPLKIKFHSPEEKEKMMSRLSNLKRAEDKFRKISITDDYTIEERQEIKKFVDEAKRRNATEVGDFYWRTRGCPKTGLELRKVPKRKDPPSS